MISPTPGDKVNLCNQCFSVIYTVLETIERRGRLYAVLERDLNNDISIVLVEHLRAREDNEKAIQ